MKEVSLVIAPYDYEQDCLDAIEEARLEGLRAMIFVMATGLGKTVTAAFCVKRWLMSRPNAKVLYICHQNYILEQAQQRFRDILGGEDSNYGFFHGYSKDKGAKYLFASFQTLRPNLEEFGSKEFEIVIVDESHHAHARTFRPVVQYFQPHLMLGMTGTPDRLDQKDIKELFGGKCVYSLPLEAALARNLLAEVDYRLIVDELVELGEIENPYRLSVTELNRLIFLPRRDEEIVKIITEKTAHISSLRMMIFGRSIRHIENLQRLIKNSVIVHSKMSQEAQMANIDAFRSGDADTILTVDKFNEGVDFPEVNVVVFLRSTQSKVVFYQQLGRGLRLSEEKSKVLVLDFVGNCQRLHILYDLSRRVQIEEQGLTRKKRSEVSRGMSIDAGHFEFTETAIKIVNLLHMAQTGYTSEILIKQLQDEAERLGRTPRMVDMDLASKQGRAAVGATFRKVFGSFGAALEVAGFAANLKHYSAEELIQQLQDEAVLLGRTPMKPDMEASSKARRTASKVAFINTFGSWTNALQKAGLEPKLRRYNNKEELLDQLRSEAKLLGRMPSLSDINRSSKAGRTASQIVFQRVFGTWNEALRAAGFEVLNVKYDKNKLIQQLKAEAELLGKSSLTSSDVEKACREGRMANLSTLQDHFGSWVSALEAAGLQKKAPTREKLIAQLIAESERLGRTPTLRDIRESSKAGKTASSYRFAKVFGSWNAALRAAKLR